MDLKHSKSQSRKLHFPLDFVPKKKMPSVTLKKLIHLPSFNDGCTTRPHMSAPALNLEFNKNCNKLHRPLLLKEVFETLDNYENTKKPIKNNSSILPPIKNNNVVNFFRVKSFVETNSCQEILNSIKILKPLNKIPSRNFIHQNQILTDRSIKSTFNHEVLKDTSKLKKMNSFHLEERLIPTQRNIKSKFFDENRNEEP